MSWFSFQYFLIPQTKNYAPNWQGSRWIQAIDTNSPTTYFRYTMNFGVAPDSGFITITANQVFRIYVNGFYIGTNTIDFVQGETPASYIFDIDSVLHTGSNVVGIRIVNVDQKMPQLRANVGVTWGKVTHYYGTGQNWQATGQTALAHPRSALNAYTWSTPKFDASQWQSAQLVQTPPVSPPLTVNPLVYEQPLPSHWISPASGQEGFFVRHITMPNNFDDALIRLTATGKADVFINDHLYIKWDGQVAVPQSNVVTYLEDHAEQAPYRNGLVMGVYNIKPYLHPGENTIAVHVQSPGTSTAKVGLDTLKSAMSLDMIVGTGNGYTNPLIPDDSWHASSQPVPNWTRSGSAAFSWRPPDPVGRPGASSSYYLPNQNTPRSMQELPPMLVIEIVIYSTVAVLAFWLFMSLIILRRFYQSNREALEAASLVFLPALAVEAVLIVLSREPLLPQPFPYTGFWALTLIVIVGVSCLGLWFHLRKKYALAHGTAWLSPYEQQQLDQPGTSNEKVQSDLAPIQHLVCWLKHNWGLIPLVLIAIPMAWYNLSYEPYWQDELASYYAAINIMKQGFPAFPSGFIYPKAELYSYSLALIMSVFGTTNPAVTRSISAFCYVVSLPILYMTGKRLFNRKVAWLATAMLTFSPYALIWSRQTRMYEPAQLMALIVLLVFHRAIKMRDQRKPVYLAITCLILAYFSHEENFIILPATLFNVLWWTREGRFGIPAILRKKHWWKAALVAVSIISIQLLLVYWTHPPTFATDQSRRPQIQPSFDNIPYYFNLLFRSPLLKDGVAPWLLTEPLIVINSLLAILGCILAFRQKDWRARYCAYFLIISSATLIFIFTMQADRYYYPLLPAYYLMGSFAIWYILQRIWRFARPHLSLQISPQTSRPILSRPIRWLLMAVVSCVCASVLLVPMLPISNYNLFVSRTLGLQYRHHFPDYDNVSQYMQKHLQKGDLVVTVAPAVIILYYVKQVDYYFSIDRSLFLFENNGKILETTSGAHPMLNEQDFQHVLSSNNRIWLITDNGGYQGGVTRNGRFTFPPPDFRMVYEGYGSAIYFRSSGG